MGNNREITNKNNDFQQAQTYLNNYEKLLNDLKIRSPGMLKRLSGEVVDVNEVRDKQLAFIEEMRILLGSYQRNPNGEDLLEMAGELKKLKNNMAYSYYETNRAAAIKFSSADITKLDKIAKSQEYEDLDKIHQLIHNELLKNFPIILIRNSLETYIRQIDVEERQKVKENLIADLYTISQSKNTDNEKIAVMAHHLLFSYKDIRSESLGWRSSLADGLKDLMNDKSNEFKPVVSLVHGFINSYLDQMKTIVDNTAYWEKQNKPKGIKKIRDILNNTKLDPIDKWTKITIAAAESRKAQHGFLYRRSITKPLKKGPERTTETNDFYEAAASGSFGKLKAFINNKMPSPSQPGPHKKS